MAAIKDIPIREAVRLQIRAEARGALDHVCFQCSQNNLTLYIYGAKRSGSDLYLR